MERSLTAKRVSTVRKVGWLSVASMLALALLAPAAPALAIDGGNPPSVECAGYAYYFKIDSGDLEERTYVWDEGAPVISNWTGQEITISNISEDGQTFDWSSVLPVSQVVTKEGNDEYSEPFDPPVFEGSVADEIQQGLSHITFCGDDPVEETEPPVTEPPVTEPPVTEPPVTEPPVTEPPVTEPPVTEPPVTQPPATFVPSQSVLSETGTPGVTLPPTDSIGGSSGPADGTWRLALIALAALLASVLVMTPARATSRRR